MNKAALLSGEEKGVLDRWMWNLSRGLNGLDTVCPEKQTLPIMYSMIIKDSCFFHWHDKFSDLDKESGRSIYWPVERFEPIRVYYFIL